jgi:hypothetical protein
MPHLVCTFSSLIHLKFFVECQFVTTVSSLKLIIKQTNKKQFKYLIFLLSVLNRVDIVFVVTEN